MSLRCFFLERYHDVSSGCMIWRENDGDTDHATVLVQVGCMFTALERFSYSKHSPTFRESNKKCATFRESNKKCATHNSDLNLLVFWFWEPAKIMSLVTGPAAGGSFQDW